MEEIFVTKPVLPPMEEYMEYLQDIWKTHNLTNVGKYTRLFMIELMDFLSSRHCLPMCNGHMALEMTLQALELKGEVITTPFTFASTTHAIWDGTYGATSRYGSAARPQIRPVLSRDGVDRRLVPFIKQL